MIIAHISDLHVRGDGEPLKGIVDSQAALAGCLLHVRELFPQPDLVLATGDLANKGLDQDYVALRRLFDGIQVPVYIVPGNHDDRDKVREVFGDWGYLPRDGRFLHYVVEDRPLRLIGLDTVVAGADGGEMCPERLAWLEARLEEAPGRPTLIFMHHAPFITSITSMDKTAFEGAAEMEAIVRRFPNVEAVVCGHMHRQMYRRWGGTLASVAPSVAFQIALDLTPGAPLSFVLEPAGVPIYLWHADTGLVTHVTVVGDYGPRHPFRMG